MILLFITNAFVILGIYNAFSPGNIFGFVREKILSMNDSTPEKLERAIWIMKPIFGCFVCMPSIWGTIGYLGFAETEWHLFPIYVFALSGFMYLIKLQYFE